jgi:hypothetical protein
MEYDGLGRRIQKVVGSDTFDYYYNEEWELLEERQNGDTDPLNQYLWHTYYIDALAMQWFDSNIDGDVERIFYLQDANFNVVAAVESGSSLVERYAYTPYGEVTFLEPNFSVKLTQASAWGATHFYTGRELDPESTFALYGHRDVSQLDGA